MLVAIIFMTSRGRPSYGDKGEPLRHQAAVAPAGCTLSPKGRGGYITWAD